jgi:hypothetical protein
MSIREHLLKFWNFWPPFLFTGIKVVKMAPDFKHIIAKLKLRSWNANYIGTQYGGSIFSLSDPFYMIMLMKNLGPGFKIMDKSAMIYFFKPGKTDLTAEFNLTDADINAIKKVLETNFKMEWSREVEIKDTSNTVVARVVKVIHIQKKVTSDKPRK